MMRLIALLTRTLKVTSAGCGGIKKPADNKQIKLSVGDTLQVILAF
jgi:hypothetical protein